MDIRKIVLYIALAFVAMSLWSAWEKDYGSKPVANTTQTNQTTTSAASPNSDIPTVPTTDAVKKVTTKTPTTSTSSKGQLIKVSTDTLQLTIDTEGGNIVDAKLLNYPVSLKDKQPITLLSDDPEKLFTAQSGLISKRGPDTEQGQAVYSSDKTSYTLAPGQKELTVNLTWQKNGIDVTKVFTFQRGSYAVNVDYKINNASTGEWQGNLYGQLKQREPEQKSSIFYLHTFTGASLSTTDNHFQKYSYKKLAEQNINTNSQAGWLAFQQRYFLSAWVPPATQTNHYYSNVNDGKYIVGFVGPAISVASGQTLTTKASTLYVGPEIAENLKAVAPNLDLTIDYGFLWIISVAIFWIMKHIYDFVGNWGWSIVLTTILIKLVFYKLSEKSYKSMAKMRKLAPRMQSLKERYGDDKQKLSQKTMELYKQEKVNPLSGCLPIIVQIPFFIALYWVLIESVELRQAPFIFWIHDLAAKDPYYVLPILMGLAMLVQQKLNPPPPDPTQAKMMMLLPVVFTVLFLNFPSGLVLYWLVNNVTSALQQWYIMYRYEKSTAKKPANAKA